MNRHAYAPVLGDSIVLDLAGCTGWGNVHERIRKAFGFPAHYGENWDAMWDCLSDLFWITDTHRIEIKGFSAMSDELQEYCRPMVDIFTDLQKRCPHMRIVYIG